MRMLTNRVKVIKTNRIKAAEVRDTRITGGRLQKRRFNLWKANPCCAMCGRLVAYPEGFELDHKVPLFEGGSDTPENCQILCVHYDVVDGRLIKLGCHAEKTVKDMTGGRSQ